MELPRSKVADFLEEELSRSLCGRYLEYLIHEREEMSQLFHDRLAELYLEMAVDSRKKGDEGPHLFLRKQGRILMLCTIIRFVP